MVDPSSDDDTEYFNCYFCQKGIEVHTNNSDTEDDLRECTKCLIIMCNDCSYECNMSKCYLTLCSRCAIQCDICEEKYCKDNDDCGKACDKCDFNVCSKCRVGNCSNCQTSGCTNCFHYTLEFQDYKCEKCYPICGNCLEVSRKKSDTKEKDSTREIFPASHITSNNICRECLVNCDKCARVYHFFELLQCTDCNHYICKVCDIYDSFECDCQMYDPNDDLSDTDSAKTICTDCIHTCNQCKQNKCSKCHPRDDVCTKCENKSIKRKRDESVTE